ncbi:MAG: hypothetical protein A3I44_00740 [Candidatus Sungbacteria bacterium RIFCSPLOWO2_02_FULL_51_17]|uniref:Uncharacterized protein n=1 Tax=Candidatus Sungbacteria bacterium RIFCSPHIGHO2_02_FULL_51_29 TaxID=1802273 RepID=A0A1G2KSR7_9BACT|nr:MAG: hypothetical protein A3C16_01270 [Candidatus Sungbacteria bacterium RIFCSPHIGHO2_02_FULL_51_29]OHA05723.1 MAG: hypothetical protein A3B29_03200 [Candidatus Sungbacteria bacterium RIFCSPLOWO2_01_FULL_51_34]OHA10650.1 MAG: hypothetical protein A3I44_00740 [Candidatus Sungbacteria bacterium RIFCSPLOWO2_02_FULL_51_17]
MDVLRDGEGLPGYVKFGREIRARLEASIQSDGWPELSSDLVSVENFFDVAKHAVTERWHDTACPLVAEHAREWAEKLPKSEKNSFIFCGIPWSLKKTGDQAVRHS